MAVIIVAYDEDFAIAKNGKIPWHLPDDVRHFHDLTLGKMVVMGRKTWDSLPPRFRPLPERGNIVVTRQAHQPPLFYDPSEPYWANSLEDALRQAEVVVEGGQVFIIGGGQIYREALEKGLVDKAIATEVKNKHNGDVFFPNLQEQGWTREVQKELEDFTIVEYTK